MKFRWDNRYLHWGVTAFLVIAASMVFYYGFFQIKSLLTGVRFLFHILAPIVYGAGIAYILTSPVNYFETKLILPFFRKKGIEFKKKGRRIIRWICVLFSIILMFIVIYSFVMLLLPQLVDSVTTLINNIPRYAVISERWIYSFIEKHGWEMQKETQDLLEATPKQLQNFLSTSILPQMQEILKNLSSGIFDLMIFLKNFLIGAIVSIYILADKEVFIAKSKMILYSCMPSKWASAVIHSMRFTDNTFSGFINGKLLDSAIIGILCYIVTTIMKMPYSLLVSVIVGVTNVIPFFGPYLGAIPSAFLILLVNPVKCLYFVIFIVILQQFDGNILGPKILGESTGLSSFMVIVAILLGGGLFGVPGMFLGVPVCAVIYAMVWAMISTSLQKKEMPAKMEDYCNIDCLDEETNQPIRLQETVHTDTVKKPEFRWKKSKNCKGIKK